MRNKTLVIAFVAIAFFLKFSWNAFTDFSPSGFGMMAYSDFTSIFTRKKFPGICVIGFNLPGKLLSSLI